MSFAVMLDLTGRHVLLAGDDPALRRDLETAGAILRDAEGGLDGVGLCCLVGPQPEIEAAARARGILVHRVPARARGGRATLVGAGPGDAMHLTQAAVAALREADVVLYDALIGADILALARPGAARIDVGKRCGRHSMNQAAISALMLRHARAGAHVVRLKGGDPMVFGRAAEEIDALREAGFPVSVIPGVTAALAAAAALGIPLTHRGLSQSLHLLTAHTADGDPPAQDWAALARLGGTLAIYMGGRGIGAVARALMDAGLPKATPAIAIANISRPDQRAAHATLAGIAAAMPGGDGPVLVLIGAALGAAQAALVRKSA